MNTKIYFLHHCFEFENAGDMHPMRDLGLKQMFIESPDKKKLGQLLEDLSVEKKKIRVVLLSRSKNSSFEEFKSCFHYIEAAGGLIQKKSSFLIIKRHGKWDLPKGKLEPREKPEEAAIRECHEECGVSGLSIIRSLHPTYHIYPYEKFYALKKSFWYLMKTDDQSPLIPQASENIEQALWMTRKKIQTEVTGHTYFTIRDVLREYGMG